MKSLAHPEWPYAGTPWAWRGFAADMLSLSHWGLHPAPQAKDIKQGVYQGHNWQSFGVYLP